ncbi:heavy metal-binding domain-containing protein [Mucilaginibacter defluvii]|uniref:Heavy metal binding domain-containing protein n=1 Tax=Mucilaginibacter defluvii TaxID=1196019 RepID=A0ABP9FW51_9SPHI
MRKLFVIALSLTVSASNLFAAQQLPAQKKAKTQKADTAKVQYTCPMDTDVIAAKPGKCPKCGMNLVKKETSKAPGKQSNSMNHMH